MHMDWHMLRDICSLGGLSLKAEDECCFLDDVGLCRHNGEEILIHLTDVSHNVGGILYLWVI